MATAPACGLTRAQIVDTFHQRIQAGQAPLLTSQEQEALALLLRDRLVLTAIQDSDTPNAMSGQSSASGAVVAARSEGGALARAERVFNGIQQWNRQHPEEAVAITASFLETKFNINRSAAQRFCETHRAAIQKMHDRLEVKPGRAKYFNRGKNIEAMVQFVGAKG